MAAETASAAIVEAVPSRFVQTVLLLVLLVDPALWFTTQLRLNSRPQPSPSGSDAALLQ
jgi:hypothetical protein